MENMRYLFEAVIKVFDHDMSIFGFTFSFFDIFLLSLFVGFVGVAIGRLFGGD